MPPELSNSDTSKRPSLPLQFCCRRICAVTGRLRGLVPSAAPTWGIIGQAIAHADADADATPGRVATLTELALKPPYIRIKHPPQKLGAK
jgi:hypothetical protein